MWRVSTSDPICVLTDCKLLIIIRLSFFIFVIIEYIWFDDSKVLGIELWLKHISSIQNQEIMMTTCNGKFVIHNRHWLTTKLTNTIVLHHHFCCWWWWKYIEPWEICLISEKHTVLLPNIYFIMLQQLCVLSMMKGYIFA